MFKLKNPFPDEVNNDDVLVQEINISKNLPIKPTYQFKKSELVSIIPD